MPVIAVFDTNVLFSALGGQETTPELFGYASAVCYNPPMPRFGFKELFLCVALIAVGVGMIRLVFQPIEIGNETTTGFFKLGLMFASGAFFGAGIAAPFKRAWQGAAIGQLVLVVVVLLLAG